MRQHSLRVGGARCTNATHICVCTASAARDVGRAKKVISTPDMFALCRMAAR